MSRHGNAQGEVTGTTHAHPGMEAHGRVGVARHVRMLKEVEKRGRYVRVLCVGCLPALLLLRRRLVCAEGRSSASVRPATASVLQKRPERGRWSRLGSRPVRCVRVWGRNAVRGNATRVTGSVRQRYGGSRNGNWQVAGSHRESRVWCSVARGKVRVGRVAVEGEGKVWGCISV